jgi:hypothetical protein
MDILYYGILKDQLVEYNKKIGKPYGNKIVSYVPTDTKYPYTVFSEIRNTTNPNFNAPHDRVASVGYRVDIVAQNKDGKDRETIAREIIFLIDKFLVSKHLDRVSFNTMFDGKDQSKCRIIATYTGNLSEFRRTII